MPASTKPMSIPIDGGTVVENISIKNLGPIVLSLPEGDALCHDAVSTTTIIAEKSANGEKFVMAIAIADFGGTHLGVLLPMSSKEARGLASALIEAANEIDGREGLH